MTKCIEEQPIYISTSDAMHMVIVRGFKKSISRQTIINWLHKHDFGVRIGHHWRIDREKFERFLNGNEN